MELSRFFVGFVAIVALLLGAGIVRFVPRRYRVRALGALSAWTLYAALLGLAGILSNAALRPPGIVYVFLPTIALIIFLTRSRAGAAIASSVPIWLLMGAQCIRFVVEILLNRLWHAGLLPTMMTFQGGNLDMLIALSAPIVAALSAARRLDLRVALAWNVLGIAMLGNIVVRGILTSPAIHAFNADAPSAIGTFPFTFIPAFIVPLALMLHVLATRAILRAQKAGTQDAAPVSVAELVAPRRRSTVR